MKLVIIIAIAVVCSVIAVLVLQEIATYQSQVAFDEYQTELERQKAVKQQTQEPEPTLGDAIEATKQRILLDPNIDADGVPP